MERALTEEEFVAELTAQQPALQAFVVSLMPGDPGVDEVLQRANITLWRKREVFVAGTNFRAWAFETVRWTLRGYLKEKQRSGWLVVDDELARAVSERMAERLPESADAPQAALRHCLEKLRPVDRELVLSHYEEGETLAECAQRCGRTVGTLKVTLFRVRAALRKCIAERLAVGGLTG